MKRLLLLITLVVGLVLMQIATSIVIELAFEHLEVEDKRIELEYSLSE